MNNFKHPISKFIFILLAAMFLSISINAQTKTSQDTLYTRISGYLLRSDYEFKKLSESAWVIYNKNETVLVGVSGDFMLAGIVVAKKADFRITADSMSEMLKLAHKLDFMKIGIDNDGDLFVRTERKGTSIEQQDFYDLIEGVTDGAKQARSRMSPYLVR